VVHKHSFYFFAKKKKYMKKLLIISIYLVLANLGYSQNFTDAVRFSNLNPTSTARSLGVGGALGAIGAEFSTLSTNPAGLGTYRHSEFVISPGFHAYKGNANFDGNSQDAKKTKLHLGNIGMVFNSNQTGNWKSINFGVGVNLLQKFESRKTYKGKSGTSLAQHFAERANGKSDDQFSSYNEGLAWEAEAIFPLFGETNKYGTDFDQIEDQKAEVSENIWTYGQVREVVFGFGGNYDGKLMIGGSLGVPIVTFQQVRRYNEEDIDDNINAFNFLKFEDQFTTSGIGINGKFGLIYKPIQNLRVGFAMHSPTLLTLKDNYSRKLDYNFSFDGSTGTKSAKTEPQSFDYKLVTPWKVSGSLAYVLKNIGIFSTDIEWIDYTSGAFEYETNYADEELTANLSIEDNLKSAVNLRFGVDVGNKDFRFRAGYGIIGSPFIDQNGKRQNIGLGFGIVQEKYFLDLGYQGTISKSKYSPYTLENSNQPIIDFNENSDKLLLTIGFKF